MRKIKPPSGNISQRFGNTQIFEIRELCINNLNQYNNAEINNIQK